jgi:Stigma-specific protein, Stig1
MTNFLRMTAFLGTLGVLVGCGDRTVADEQSAPPKPPDMGAPAESEGESEGEVVCQGGLTACDGECVDLTSDDEHCGACGHACRDPFWAGHCLEGACPSASWCGGAGQGLETCEDVCALYGQTCDETPRTLSRGCGGGYQLYFDDGLERCEQHFGGQTGVQASCTTPIDWSIEGGWENTTAQAVACCCTQNLPP